MKTCKLLFIILFYASFVPHSYGQEYTVSKSIDYKKLNQKDWPAALDAVTSTGIIHKVLLEND